MRRSVGTPRGAPLLARTLGIEGRAQQRLGKSGITTLLLRGKRIAAAVVRGACVKSGWRVKGRN